MALKLNLYLGSSQGSASRADVIAGVFDIYRQIVEEEPSLDSSLEDLSPTEKNHFVGRCLAKFNVQADASETFKTVGDVVEYIIQNEGALTSDILARPFATSEEALIKLAALDDLLSAGYSSEGLLNYVADAFLGIYNTMKINVTRFGKALKQSEMVLFHNHNHFLCKDVEAADYTMFMDFHIDVPTGLKVKMLDGVEFCKAAYQHLDCLNYVDSTAMALETAIHDVSNSVDLSNGFEPFKAVDGKAKVVKFVGGLADKIYKDNSPTMKKKLKDVYGSMKEFADVRVSLMEMEHFLQDVNTIYEKVDKMADTISSLTTLIQDAGADVPVNYVKELAGSIRMLGQIVDIYGNTGMRQMSLEHNHVINYENIYARL